ncbi:unnamed protein product [Schistosoma turkestanicum]|nr:unnamed protein product [Schistosoma turkestanicum]
MISIKKYIDQNAPSSQDFYQLIHSYQLEFGVILLRDYKQLLEIYENIELSSLENFKIHTNYLIHYTWTKLHTNHWKNVHLCWRKLYSSLKLLLVLYSLHKIDPQSENIDEHSDHYSSMLKELIKELDLSLIMGYPIFDCFASKLASKLHSIVMTKSSSSSSIRSNEVDLSISFQLEHDHDHDVDQFIDVNIKANLNKLDRIDCPSIEAFNNLMKLNKPFIIMNAINFWPAYNNNQLNTEHHWTLNYWRTNFGHRLVPVEIGSKYTEENWGQKLMTINQFIDKYFQSTTTVDKTVMKGYLAQYEIFSQIPELENDIHIPDYCSVTGDLLSTDNLNQIETNLWFGPKNTISPLHHDSDRANLLTQIQGFKYVCLYPASETNCLYAYNENIMLNNTSRIDLDNVDLKKFPKFQNAHGYYGLLSPGEMLYIPPRCWHYVRSLSASFSVNFWWNVSASLITSWGSD